MLLYVRNEHAKNVQVNLRVQDVSRQALTWGTQIPVVTEAELFDRPVQMINVPSGSRFRQTVRIYEPEASGRAEVEVRVYGVNVSDRPVTDTLVGSRRHLLAVQENNGNSSGFKYRPGYAQLSWLEQDFPALSSFQQARIEVVPVTAALRFRAFTSVTNNETQHITLVTPELIAAER